jgi:predicted unusual protein kinase regulating ubiquinone biosynthesis (AarF/ABC1/UbiB family)
VGRGRRAARTLRILAFAARMAWDLAWLERRRHRLPPGVAESLEERVYRRQGARLRSLAVAQGGLLIKLGQFLSTRVDLLPEAFTHELVALQDLVPPVPWEAVRRQLEGELGHPVDQVFDSFDPVPAAAASLGQVHRAVLRGGQPVAVKVQRPGVEELVAADLAAVRTVARYVQRWTRWGRQVEPLALVDELERTVGEELDYLVEAKHAERFRRNFADQPEVTVPRVVHELTTRRVLVMERVAGWKVDDRQALLAAGVDVRRTAGLLVRTYLQQVLRDGFFHADPHPGNVFVRDDGGLVYLDFGMMGEIAPEDRATFSRLVAAVIRRDMDALVEAIRDLGFLRPHANPEALKKGLSMALDHLSGVPFQRPSGEEFQEFLDEMREFLYSEPFRLPSQYAFLGRAIGILLGLTTTLDPEIDFVRLLQENALPYLRLEAEASPVWETVSREVRELALALYRLPRRLDRALQRLETGELVLRVQVPGLLRSLEARRRAHVVLARTVLTGALVLSATWLTVAGHAAEARIAWAVVAVLTLSLVWAQG